MSSHTRFLPLAAAALLLAVPLSAGAQGGTAGGTTGGTAGGTTGGTTGGTAGGHMGHQMGQGGTMGGPSGGTAGGTAGGTMGGKEGGTAGATSMNDAQIAAIVVAANTTDIESGREAEKKSKNPEVKKFAKQMVTDHTALNKESESLVKKLKVKPEESDTSRKIKEDAKTQMASMKKLSGAQFDRAYVDNEVTVHQNVLDALDNTLIPNAKNPELKALLEKARPTIAQHLEHARMLQKSVAEK